MEQTKQMALEFSVTMNIEDKWFLMSKKVIVCDQVNWLRGEGGMEVLEFLH